MTTQIPDTVILCGHRFEVPQMGYLPADHPGIRDLSKPGLEGFGIRLPRCSALHRGYTAEWEIQEEGGLRLLSLTDGYRLTGGPLHAEWVHTCACLPVGEIDDVRSRVLQYELVRNAVIELDITGGTVIRWRIVQGSGKGFRWKKGFNWTAIAVALEAKGIGPDYQPPPPRVSEEFRSIPLDERLKQSAALLERARRGESGTGKVLTLDDWDTLHKGWADPFPNLDVFDAVRALRCHGPVKPSKRS